MYNLPDVYSTTSTVPSTSNLQVVATCSVWLSVNTGSQSWGYCVDSVVIVFVGCQLFKESMDILMSPEPSTSTQNHEVCVDCTILQEVTRNNQQIQCLQNQLNTPKIENQYLQITTQNMRNNL
jgi:hypothetical protein